MEQLNFEFKEYRYAVDSEVYRLIKVAKDWDSLQFREFLNSIETYLARNPAFHDYRNVLVRFGVNETLGIIDEIVVKKFKLTRKYDQFRFRFLPSKAFRSLKTALALLQIGLKTPRPIAIIEERGKYNRLVNCYYLTEFLTFDYSFYQVINDFDDTLKSKLIAETAHNIRLMHDAGIIHNDLHASNILIKNIEVVPELYFIDLNRARQRKTLSIKSRAKDLGRLSLNQSDLIVFLKKYNPISSKEFLTIVEQMQCRRKTWIRFKDSFRQLKTKLKKKF
ncbi:MAG: lipopolysaccharide kinase InaA family protein [Bacteroidota bacterium]